MHLPKSRTKAITSIPQIVTYAVREKGMEYKGEQRWALVEPWCKHWSYCSWQKGTSPDEATLNSEEIKSLAIARIELRLSEGISKGVSEWVSQPVSQKFLKFHINLVEGFMIDLKAFLGLAMPNQSSLDATK